MLLLMNIIGIIGLHHHKEIHNANPKFVFSVMSGSGLHEGIIAFSHTVRYVENRILTSVIYMPQPYCCGEHISYIWISLISCFLIMP